MFCGFCFKGRVPCAIRKSGACVNHWVMASFSVKPGQVPWTRRPQVTSALASPSIVFAGARCAPAHLHLNASVTLVFAVMYRVPYTAHQRKQYLQRSSVLWATYAYGRDVLCPHAGRVFELFQCRGPYIAGGKGGVRRARCRECKCLASSVIINHCPMEWSANCARR